MILIALDDEPLALALLANHLKAFPEWEMPASFTNAVDAAEYIRRNRVDLLVSDINMPDISGLKFVSELGADRPLVIFLTAFREHALEGYDLDVVDYLIKPVSPGRLGKALDRASELLGLRRKALMADSLKTEEYFYVFTEYQQVKIVIREIVYIEAMGDYVKIWLSGVQKPVITLERLKELADRLHVSGLRRIHRSFVVNPGKVEALQKSRVMVAGKWLPVGDAFAGNIDWTKL